MTSIADRYWLSLPGPGEDGDVVPIGDPEDDEGYEDEDEDDEDEEDEEDDGEEPWQVAGVVRPPVVCAQAVTRRCSLGPGAT